MDYIFTIDIGTTSVKCGIFDTQLKPLGFSTAEYALIMPSACMVEVEPDTYIQKIAACAKDLKALGLDMKKVRQIVITTQGETMIPLDAANIPMCNAIV
ncbi:MAG: FGGY family carbohydrate kinase, partial [Christensenellaceae bacterium]